VELPSRKTPRLVLFRLRHPKGACLSSALLSSEVRETGLSKKEELVELKGLTGKVVVVANYASNR
jgi:hypothetical protein